MRRSSVEVLEVSLHLWYIEPFILLLSGLKFPAPGAPVLMHACCVSRDRQSMVTYSH